VTNGPRSRPRLEDALGDDDSSIPQSRARLDSTVVPNDGNRTPSVVPLVHHSERGELRVWLAAPLVMVVKYIGYTDSSHVAFAESAFDATLGRRTEVHLYVDCGEQTGHDAAFRDGSLTWARRIRLQTQTYCVLVRSRIVALGVAVANMQIGGPAIAMSDRNAFYGRLALSIGKSLADDPR
jgi:hypothetical protein